MDTHRPGHLGDPADRLLDIPGRHHHQIVELVHHHQDEGQPLEPGLDGVVLGHLLLALRLGTAIRNW